MELSKIPEIKQPPEAELRSMIAGIESMVINQTDIDQLKERLRWLLGGTKLQRR